MQAVILSIGDELVLGQTVDTNSAYLSEQLVRRGIGALYHQTVADDLPAIKWAIEEAARRAQLVIITGGLGPTEDDLTRQALAAALGVGLVENPQSMQQITEWFARRGRPMNERNRIQALQPVGTRMLPNTRGTAPGIAARLGDARIYVMPGVPSEMKGMFEQSIVPELEASMAGRAAILATKINTFGWGESNIAEKLSDLMVRDRNPKVGTTVSGGLVSVRVRSEFPDPDEAARQLEATAQEVERRLSPTAFGRDDDSLQEALVRLLAERKLTVATAESCTGGMLGSMLADVPGVSAVYLGGWVTYANAMKTSQLGVSEALLAEHGAVSEPVARAMAAGALARSHADLAAAITGIAGPGGGTPEKPVGTVYIAVADRHQTRVMHYIFPDGRTLIRDHSARCAMAMLRLHLLGESFEHIRWGRELD